MKEIGGGTMTMGSGYRPDERPLHAIQVAAFCMDRTEVTTQAYEACLTAGACTRPKGTHPRCNAGKADRGEHPINCVDWKQATTYCDVAGKRLPTEEEWEFAARGPAGRAFPWGDQLTGSEICWNGFRNTRKEHGWEGTCPVGSYPAGDTPGTGIADLSGGVTEWLSTFDCPYDPKERCGKTRRGLRGGSWFDNTEAYVRAASRGGYAPTEQSYFVGFRCARDRR
jgi:formylglycine-generating enzyme required for sulfatase activity